MAGAAASIDRNGGAVGAPEKVLGGVSPTLNTSWHACGQAFAADLERLFGELEQMEPEITVIAGRGGGASAASVSLDETRVNRLILQVRGRCLRPRVVQPCCNK